MKNKLNPTLQITKSMKTLGYPKREDMYLAVLKMDMTWISLFFKNSYN